MGALRQPRLEPSKKQPTTEKTLPRRDEFGRDPESPAEKLRSATDYDKDIGFSPLYHAALADLPRLSSGAVCYAFVLVVNMLSYGRGKDKAGKRFDSTLPISAQALADLCRANVRDIQRQLAELKERGLIKTKLIKKGGSVEYVISLSYRDWQGLDDYSVWKRKQMVVSIADEEGEEEEGDEPALEISKDAVHLGKPQTVRPGRASRPKKVSVGIADVAYLNDSPHVDLVFKGVIQSGHLVVSASSPITAKGESKANAERHTCRDGHPGESQKGEDRANAERHTRRSVPSQAGNGLVNDRLIKLFDPLLQKSGHRLLAIDPKALNEASGEVGAMPHEFLVHHVMGPKGRGSRPISGPKVVASIVKEARLAWEKLSAVAAVDEKRMLQAEARERERLVESYRRMLADPADWDASDLEFAREQLKELES